MSLRTLREGPPFQCPKCGHEHYNDLEPIPSDATHAGACILTNGTVFAARQQGGYVPVGPGGLPKAPPGGTGESGREVPLELRDMLRPILVRLVRRGVLLGERPEAPLARSESECVADALDAIDRVLDLP